MAWRFDPIGHVAVEMQIMAIKCDRGQKLSPPTTAGAAALASIP